MVIFVSNFSEKSTDQCFLRQEAGRLESKVWQQLNWLSGNVEFIQNLPVRISPVTSRLFCQIVWPFVNRSSDSLLCVIQIHLFDDGQDVHCGITVSQEVTSVFSSMAPSICLEITPVFLGLFFLLNHHCDHRFRLNQGKSARS